MAVIEQRIAVKAVVADGKGRVLLLCKSQDDARHAGKSGRYNLPGGKIQPGETIGEALAREILEETGLTITGYDERPLLAGEWRPNIAGVQYQIVGLFWCVRHGVVRCSLTVNTVNMPGCQSTR